MAPDERLLEQLDPLPTLVLAEPAIMSPIATRIGSHLSAIGSFPAGAGSLALHDPERAIRISELRLREPAEHRQ